MYYFISILFSSLVLARSESYDDKKYLDGLKEPDKREFFEKVMRRIAEEIKPKLLPKDGSQKINETELENHSDYVRRIINEERQNFRKDGNDKVNVETEVKQNSNEDNYLKANGTVVKKDLLTQELEATDAAEAKMDLSTQQEELELTANDGTVVDKDISNQNQASNEGTKSKRDVSTKPFPDANDDVVEKDSSKKQLRANDGTVVKKDLSNEQRKTSHHHLNRIDLTMREGNNKGNKNDDTTTKYVTVPVRTIYDVDDSTTAETTYNDDIQVKDTKNIIRRSLKSTNVLSETTSKEESKVTTATDVKDHPTVKSLDVAPNVMNPLISTTEGYKREVSKVTDRPKDTSTVHQNKVTKGNADATSIIYTTLNVTEYVTVGANLNTSKNDKSKDTKQANSKTSVEKDISNTETKQKEIKRDNNPKIGAETQTTIKNQNSLTVNENTSEKTSNNNLAVTSKEKLTQNQTLSVEITTKRKVTVESSRTTDTDDVTVTTSKVIKADDNATKSQTPALLSEELKTLEIAENVVKALRMGIDGDLKKSKGKSRHKKKKSNKKTVNVYGFYDKSEEHSQNRGANKEQPYYVPIYNYYANNAYYNAYNKFGPNNKKSSPNGNVHFKPVSDYDEPNLPAEKYHRAFFKKSQQKNPKNGKGNSVTFRYSVPYPVLPYVVGNSYKPTITHDYDYIYGNDYLRSGALRTNGDKGAFREKEVENNLKDRLKTVRESIIAYRKEHTYESDEADKRDRGWLDSDTEYHGKKTTSRNKLKKIKNPFHQAFDYVGEANNRFTNKKRDSDVIIAIDRQNSDKKRENEKITGEARKIIEYLDGIVKTNRDSDVTADLARQSNRGYKQKRTSVAYKIMEPLDILKSNRDLDATLEIIQPKDKSNTKKPKDKVAKYIREAYPLLQKLIKIIDFEEDKEVEACVRVMGDLIQTNNEGLDQYDWLESTVNIQSAIGKLSDLITTVMRGQEIHPSDAELLKYTTYLFYLASNLRANPENSESRSVLPKPHTKGKRVKGFKDRVWLYRIPDPDYGYHYENMLKFLDDLGDSLYDLHNSLKHIAGVTTLKSQNWFTHLKDLYLHKPSRKQLLELVLHLGTTRLFNLIEDSSKNGIEVDFLRFIHENQIQVSKVREAFEFVTKVLEASLDYKLVDNY